MLKHTCKSTPACGLQDEPGVLSAIVQSARQRDAYVLCSSLSGVPAVPGTPTAVPVMQPRDTIALYVLGFPFVRDCQHDRGAQFVGDVRRALSNLKCNTLLV
ncbi:hypothetical protein LJR267_009187 [Paraburkholderia hospita]|jgi:hypothetical protein|uniref:hypothetical protein n=1 Tax=Paraburkholderia hospita TaxID=169430 RepID=UPI003ECF7A78